MVLWILVQLFEDLVVLAVRVFLEGLILVDFVRFQLQQPAHRFWFNVELLILQRFKRVNAVGEYFVIVDFFVVFAEQELGGCRVLLRVYVVKLHAQLIVLEYLFLHYHFFVLYVLRVRFYQVGGNVILRHEVVLLHHHPQQLLLGIVILLPNFVVYLILLRVPAVVWINGPNLSLIILN